MLEQIKDSILSVVSGTSSQELKAKVVSVFAEKEVERRVSLVVKAVTVYDELIKAYNSVNKPDNKFTDSSGNPVELYSEKRKQEIAKAKSNIDKLVKAVTDALDSNKWDELEKHLSNKSSNETN